MRVILRGVFLLFIFFTVLQAGNYTQYLKSWSKKPKYTLRGSSIDYATIDIVCKNGRKGVLLWNVEPNMFIFSVRDLSGRTMTGKYVGGGGGGADYSKNNGQEKAVREYCR